MKVDFWCSRRPYVDHAAPVWLELPEETRGQFVTPLLDRAAALGIDAVRPSKNNAYIVGEDDLVRGNAGTPLSGDLIVFLSRCEIAAMPADRPLVFMEHGVGPTYDGQSHLPYMDRIELVLTTPANAPGHIELFGDRVQEIGCPKLDKVTRRKKRPTTPPTVAVSHHWNQRAYPETMSAWPWDKEAWERIAASGEWKLLGHKHPGDPRDVLEWWDSFGVETVDSFDEIMERADLYVADNTSTLYEFASLDRPVVVLSPPFYRRDVKHGLRFWDHVPGVQVSHPDELDAALHEAWADFPARAALRHKAVEAAYGVMDGQAARRAREHILACLERVNRFDTGGTGMKVKVTSEFQGPKRRHLPGEVLDVGEATATRMFAAKVAEAVEVQPDEPDAPAPQEAPVETEQVDDGLEDKKQGELRTIAREDHGLTFRVGTKNDEMIAAIRAARKR